MEEDRNILLGRKLRKLRKLYNYTQKECIEALKLKRQQDLSDLEKGRKYFTHALIQNICKFFSVSYSDFISFQNLESFPTLEISSSIPLIQKGVSIEESNLQTSILRKQVLLSQIELMVALQNLAKITKSDSKRFHPENEIPIYVLI